MAGLQSKLPDFNELGSMAYKLFKDIRTSVGEIVTSYKQKRSLVSASVDTLHSETKTAKKTPVKRKASAKKTTDD